MATTYLFPPDIPSLGIVDRAERFPIHRIYCIARNYADHAREMGGDPTREAPFFFNKAADSVVTDGRFPYPPASRDVHHEVEMVVALHRGGQNIAAEQALTHVFGYALGIDMTRRDLQAEAKKQGRPWCTAKGFDHASPMSPLVPADRIGHPAQGRIWLAINGELRQEGDLADMSWGVAEIISQLSQLFELKAGDLIFTGTPAGVGPVQRGETLTAGIDGVATLTVDVV